MSERIEWVVKGQQYKAQALVYVQTGYLVSFLEKWVNEKQHNTEQLLPLVYIHTYTQTISIQDSTEFIHWDTSLYISLISYCL